MCLCACDGALGVVPVVGVVLCVYECVCMCVCGVCVWGGGCCVVCVWVNV